VLQGPVRVLMPAVAMISFVGIRASGRSTRLVIHWITGVQPAGRGIEVLVGRAEGVGGMDAAVKPTWRYSRRPLA
jgi:hypothetical protein